MRKETPLDYAEFLLTQTRTRCDLYICGDGVREKLASGYLKPFIINLRIAELQFARGSNVIRLEPPPDLYRKTNNVWFTKGTLERFVRYVSTPEVLEQVKNIEDELSQLEQVRIALSKTFSQSQLRAVPRDAIYYPTDGYQERTNMSMMARRFSTDADDAEASKRELLRAMDGRLIALNQEQQMAYSRAIAAGFDGITVANLIDFSDHFGAERLRDACLKFMVLSRKLNIATEADESMDSPSADAASSCSDMSLESGTDIELTSETETTSQANIRSLAGWRDVQVDQMPDCDNAWSNLDINEVIQEQPNFADGAAPARTRSRWGPPERIQINSFEPEGCFQESEIMERSDFLDQNAVETEQVKEADVLNCESEGLNSSTLNSLERSDLIQKPLTIVPPNIGPRIVPKQVKDKKGESVGKGATFLTRLQKMAQQVEARRSSEDLGVHFTSVKMNDKPFSRGSTTINPSLLVDSQNSEPAVAVHDFEDESLNHQVSKPSSTSISAVVNIQNVSERSQVTKSSAINSAGNSGEDELIKENQNEEKSAKIPGSESENGDIKDKEQAPVSTSARRLSVAAAISLFEKKKTDKPEPPSKNLVRQESLNGTSQDVSVSTSEKAVLRRWSAVGSASSKDGSTEDKDPGVVNKGIKNINAGCASVHADSTSRNNFPGIDQKQVQNLDDKKAQTIINIQSKGQNVTASSDMPKAESQQAPREDYKNTQSSTKEHTSSTSQSHSVDSSTIFKGDLQKQFKLQLEKSLARSWNRSPVEASAPPKPVVKSPESLDSPSKTLLKDRISGIGLGSSQVLQVMSSKDVVGSANLTPRKFGIPPPPPPPKPVPGYPKVATTEFPRGKTPEIIACKPMLASDLAMQTLRSSPPDSASPSSKASDSTTKTLLKDPTSDIGQSKYMSYSLGENKRVPKDHISIEDPSITSMSLPKDLHCITESPKVSDLHTKRLLVDQAPQVKTIGQPIVNNTVQTRRFEQEENWDSTEPKHFPGDRNETLTNSKQDKNFHIKSPLNKETFTGKVLRHSLDTNSKLEYKPSSHKMQQNVEKRQSPLPQNSSADLYMQALVVMMDSQHQDSLNLGDDDSFDEQRGKFYEQYRRLRDAKQLKEHPAKRAEREAKLKTMKETLDRRKFEMGAGPSKSSKKHPTLVNAPSKLGKLEAKKSISIEAQKRQKELGEESETVDQEDCLIYSTSPVPRSHTSSTTKALNTRRSVQISQKVSPAPRSSLSSSVSSPTFIPKNAAVAASQRRGALLSHSAAFDNTASRSVSSMSDLKKETRKASSRRSSASLKTHTRVNGHSRTMSDAAIDDALSGTVYEESKSQSSVNRKIHTKATQSNDRIVLETSKPRKRGNAESMVNVVSRDVKGQISAPKMIGDSVKQKASQNLNKALPVKNINNNLESDLRKTFVADNLCEHGLADKNDEEGEQDETDYEEATEIFLDASSDEGVLCIDDMDQVKSVQNILEYPTAVTESFVSENGCHEDRRDIATLEVSQSDSNSSASFCAAPLPLDSKSSYSSAAASPGNSTERRAGNISGSVNLRLTMPYDSPLGSPAIRSTSQTKFSSDQYGSPQRASPMSQSPKEHKGFKRLLHFGRKSRNADADSGDCTPSSEWGDDVEESKELVRQSSDDVFRRMKLQDADHSTYEGQGEGNLLRSSIPAPPSSFKLQEDHLSGSSLLKGPKAFFSLSTFRSRGSEGKSR